MANDKFNMMDARNAATGGDEGIIPCSICGTKDQNVLFDAGVAQKARIVTCAQCGLMFSSPRAGDVDHELHEAWESDGVLEGVTTDRNHHYHWRYEKESGQVRDFAKSRKTLRRLYPNGGRMIEVGSGMGYLLRSFKDEGWDVVGIDPWRAAPAHTSKVHGFETIPDILENADIPDASADVVILLHVIEHVPDPVATLREIHRVLKPGGHLVIETPRYDTLMFKILRHRERSLRCDGHIYFFTFASLKAAYEKAGFSEVETSAVGRTLSVERLFWNIGTVAGSKRLRDGLGRFAKLTRLNKLHMTLNLRDMQRAVIRKESS